MAANVAKGPGSGKTRAGTKTPNYAVPAVEKALDVLELLSGSVNGMSMSEMVAALDRSMGELYRVVIYLERRGYLMRDRDSDRYALSLRLFEMSHRHPPAARLVKQAVPILENLAEETQQSCHLGVMHDDTVLILATGRSPMAMAYTVRIGAIFPVFETSSGTVIAAFLPDEQREALLARQPTKELPEIRDRIASVQACGYERHTSLAVAGIVNLSYPVFDHSGVVGAITVPFLEQVGLKLDADAVLHLAGTAAQALSISLGGDVVTTDPSKSRPRMRHE